MLNNASATLDKVQVGTLQTLSHIFDKTAELIRQSARHTSAGDEPSFKEQLDRSQLTGTSKAVLEQYTEQLVNIKKSVSIGLRQAFNRISQSQSRKIGAAAKLTLELVSKDDVELQIVLAHFEKQIIEAYQEPLALLSMRFDHICRRDLAIEQLPVSPVSLGQILTDSIKPLDLEPEDKKKLLMALLIALKDIYTTLLNKTNQLFIQYKVLVNLSPRHLAVKKKKEEQRKQAAKKRKSLLGLDDDADNMAQASEQIHQFLKRLTISDKQHQVQNRLDAPPISQQQLLNQLNKITHQTQQKGSYQTLVDNKSLARQLSDAVGLANFSLSDTMAKTISLISMVFDDLFNNKNIPDEIQALLADLQAPLLKAAIQDDRFLADSNNPAQTLLNNIAEAGLGWSPEASPENDVLYQKIADIVKTVKQNFEDDYLIFDDAISDFFSFREDAQQQTDQIETRIIDRETAQARLEKAREVAKTHIDKKFSRLQLPPAIVSFLQDTWQQVLFFIYNKEPDKSAIAWQDAMEIERGLLTNLSQKQSDDVEVFLIVLEEKLGDCGINKAQAAKQCEQIRQVLLSHSGQAINIDEKADFEEEQGQSSSEEDAALLADVMVGSWLLKHDQDPPLKIKVAAHIKFNDAYVMVKRTGIKEGTYTSQQLADLLRSGKMQLLSNQLVFDSALENVISNIR